MKRTLLLCVLAVALCAVATANIIPTWSSTTPSGSVFIWSYHVDLSADQKLIGGLNGTLPASVSNLNLTYAPFFTIYDFAGFNGVVTAPAGWAITSQTPGITPSDVAPVDNSIPNLTWVYTGAGTLTGPLFLGDFTMQSIYGIQSDVSFTARAFRSTGVNAGQVIDNVGPTQGPSGVPEPMTFLLIGTGLVGLGLLRRRARKS